MALANFGPKIFEVSSNKYYTFEGLNYTTAVETETIENEGGKPSTYIKGYSLDTLSLAVKLNSKFHIIDEEIESWRNIMKSNTPYYFIIGNKPLCPNKMKIKSLSFSETQNNRNGKFMKVTINIQFEEFVKEGTKEQKEAASSKGKKNTKTKPDYASMIDLAQKRNNANAQQAYENGVKEG